jgi:hypothetical protein
MKPAFEEHGMDQALEKTRDALHHRSGGFGAPSWAEAHAKDLVEALEELERRMRAQHVSLQRGAFPAAIYAARELRKYIAGAQSDIANADAADIYYRSLAGLIDELRPLDRELAKPAA